MILESLVECYSRVILIRHSEKGYFSLKTEYGRLKLCLTKCFLIIEHNLSLTHQPIIIMFD
jgi:hypothetical protein